MAVTLGFAALLLVAGPMAWWFRRMRQVQLPKNRTPFVAAWAGGALLGAAALYAGAGWVGGIPATLAILAGSLFTILVAVSAQKVGVDAITVGSSLPDFTALDENGEDFTLSSLAGTPVLIKFFRGHW